MFDMGIGETGRLLIIIHHLAVDALSWPILLQDFEAAYSQLKRGAAVKLPCKTTSIKQWADRLHKYRRSESLRQAADYWLDPAEGEAPLNTCGLQKRD